MSATLEVPHRYLKLSQCAAALGMEERTVKTWLENGTLPNIKPGGRCSLRYVLAADLLEFALKSGITCRLELAL